MLDSQRESLYEFIAGVYAFYRAACSPFALAIWWEATNPFDFEAVKNAFNRHLVNPDNGQYLPKPADVVKLIGGGSQDGALLAWSKVEKAIRLIGPYQTVTFDDPGIQAVISDMGGWIELCMVLDDELPFKAKEFENRYRGYRTRGQIENFPAKLTGIIDATNLPKCYAEQPPVLIGEPEKAALILTHGGEGKSLQITDASKFVPKQLTDRSIE